MHRKTTKKSAILLKIGGYDVGNSNKTLSAASKAKQDEFYTQLSDIENELKHYKGHFKGKVVFCNCDDPYESNFFKYFAMNFNHLGLKSQRVWRGKTYANVMDDCIYCPFCISYEEDEESDEPYTYYLLCTGKSGISSIYDIKNMRNREKNKY